MSDSGAKKMTLNRLVRLTNEFVNAAKFEVKCRDTAKPDLYQNLTPDQQLRLKELKHEAGQINGQALKLMHQKVDDPAIVSTLTAQMNRVSLQMHDVLIESAQELLGDAYLKFIAPDELRSASAIELLQQNRAITLAGLVKTTVQ